MALYRVRGPAFPNGQRDSVAIEAGSIAEAEALGLEALNDEVDPSQIYTAVSDVALLEGIRLEYLPPEAIDPVTFAVEMIVGMEEAPVVLLVKALNFDDAEEAAGEWWTRWVESRREVPNTFEMTRIECLDVRLRRSIALAEEAWLDRPKGEKE